MTGLTSGCKMFQLGSINEDLEIGLPPYELNVFVDSTHVHTEEDETNNEWEGKWDITGELVTSEY